MFMCLQTLTFMDNSCCSYFLFPYFRSFVADLLGIAKQKSCQENSKQYGDFFLLFYYTVLAIGNFTFKIIEILYPTSQIQKTVNILKRSQLVNAETH